MPFCSGFSRPKDQTRASCIADRFFTTEPPGKPLIYLNCIKSTILTYPLFGPRRICLLSKNHDFGYVCIHVQVFKLLELKDKVSSLIFNIVVVQPLSPVWLFVTPWPAAHQASLSFTISRRWFKLMSMEFVMPSEHLVLYHPLPLLLSIFPCISLSQ